MTQTQNADQRPIAGDPKLFIEELGYDIDTDSEDPGHWMWATPSAGWSSYTSAQAALEGAWDDAVEQTQAIGNITSKTWECLNFEQQKAAIIQALSDSDDAIEAHANAVEAS